MDGWLVVVSGEINEVPIRMFSTLEEATDTLARMSDKALGDIAEDVANKLILGSGSIWITVLAIQILDGFPVSSVTLRVF